MSLSWMLLFLAGVLEIVWAVALKQAYGFTRLWPSVIGIAAAVLSLLLLTAAMKSLPVATAYAVWVGVGVIGVAAVGILVLGENASPARLGCLTLILAGIVGLRLLEGGGGS